MRTRVTLRLPRIGPWEPAFRDTRFALASFALYLVLAAMVAVLAGIIGAPRDGGWNEALTGEGSVFSGLTNSFRVGLSHSAKEAGGNELFSFG